MNVNTRLDSSGAPISADDFTILKLGWIETVAQHPTLTRTDLATAVVLATRFLNRQTGLAWPSVETLAEAVGVTRRAVQKALRKLEAERFVQAVEHGGGKRRTTKYALVKGRTSVRGIDSDTANTSSLNSKNIREQSHQTANAGARNSERQGHQTANARSPEPFEKNPLKEPYEARNRASAAPDGAEALCALEQEGAIGLGENPSPTKTALERQSPRASTEETDSLPSAPSRPRYEWETIAGLRELVKRRSAEADAIRALAEQASQGNFAIDHIAQATPPLTELLCQEKALKEALRVPFITSKAGRDDFRLAIELTHCLYKTRKAALGTRRLARIVLQHEAK